MKTIEFVKLKVLWVVTAGLLLAGCSMKNKHPEFSLQGAWVMTQVTIPEGDMYPYSPNGGTWLRLYDADSVMYECQLTVTEQALVVKPEGKSVVTLIDKGGGEHLYLEEDDPRPLTVLNDSTITIQRMGRIYMWQRADSITKEWGMEIRALIDSESGNEMTANDTHSYVLSAKEREQASVIHKLIYAIIAIVVLVLITAQIALANRRAKRRLQLQLRQIHEEHDARPQQIRLAIASVESAYFSSDEYHALQHHIAAGQRLKEEDWTEMETQLKKVYPGFTTQLRNLHSMSELEYQTCLLIKLRISPKDIATVLNRDMSTISTVRSRLYHKVFGRKGGAREWDDFVLSIGT